MTECCIAVACSVMSGKGLVFSSGMKASTQVTVVISSKRGREAGPRVTAHITADMWVVCLGKDVYCLL